MQRMASPRLAPRRSRPLVLRLQPSTLRHRPLHFRALQRVVNSCEARLSFASTCLLAQSRQNRFPVRLSTARAMIGLVSYEARGLAPAAGLPCASPGPHARIRPGSQARDDFYLASYDESLGYFQKLAQSTGKLSWCASVRPRAARWYIAVISSAQILRPSTKQRHDASLALVKGLTEARRMSWRTTAK